MKSKTKQEIVSIAHYAPNVSVTALDYGLPFTLEERMRRSEQKIKEFLSGTTPDCLCENFFDSYTYEEEAVLISALREQTPDHDNMNRALSDRQKAELQRLDSALAGIDRMIRACENELSELQQLFDKYNG